MISLTCDYHPGAPDDATIHRATEILSSGTHVSSSQDTRVVWQGLNVKVIFGQKSRPKFAICRKELKIKTSGVIFRGAYAYCVQKAIAPQEQAFCQIFGQKKE